MAIVRHKHTAGSELTPEERAAKKARLEAAARLPYIYDPDCPLLTESQLAEFRPVNFATMEERAEATRKAGIVDPDAEALGKVTRAQREGREKSSERPLEQAYSQ